MGARAQKGQQQDAPKILRWEVSGGQFWRTDEAWSVQIRQVKCLSGSKPWPTCSKPFELDLAAFEWALEPRSQVLQRTQWFLTLVSWLVLPCLLDSTSEFLILFLWKTEPALNSKSLVESMFSATDVSLSACLHIACCQVPILSARSPTGFVFLRLYRTPLEELDHWPPPATEPSNPMLHPPLYPGSCRSIHNVLPGPQLLAAPHRPCCAPQLRTWHM